MESIMKRTYLGLSLHMLLSVAVSEGIMVLLKLIRDSDFQEFLNLLFFDVEPEPQYLLVFLISFMAAAVVFAFELYTERWLSGEFLWGFFIPVLAPYIIVVGIFLVKMVLLIFGVLCFAFVLWMNSLFSDSDS